ncbi:MAG: hypothetical protein QY307_02415 [Acidimicrobiia bacterium]|nr:MAG: hypothetical protein QY307_02415 [Acidimicrobiia bacterium]
MFRKGLLFILAALTLIVGACGDDDAATTTTAAAATTTAAAATTTAAAATTTEATAATTTTEAAATTTTEAASGEGALVQNPDGSYTVDWSALSGPISYIPPQGGSSDPFYHVHNDPDTDGFFLSIEAYTVYGPGWTGELGTFDIDCSSAGTGICVYFDADGPGPIPVSGADGSASGEIEFTILETDRFEATVSNLTFGDGTTIPGPFVVSAG